MLLQIMKLSHLPRQQERLLHGVGNVGSPHIVKISNEEIQGEGTSIQDQARVPVRNPRASFRSNLSNFSTPPLLWPDGLGTPSLLRRGLFLVLALLNDALTCLLISFPLLVSWIALIVASKNKSDLLFSSLN